MFDQYYRWQRKVYYVLQEPKFVEITELVGKAASPAVSVKLRDTSVEVYNGCDAALAEAVILVLKYFTAVERVLFAVAYTEMRK